MTDLSNVLRARLSRIRSVATLSVVVAATSACPQAPGTVTPVPGPAPVRQAMPWVPAIIPAPASYGLSGDTGAESRFAIDSTTTIWIDADAGAPVDSVARFLSRVIAPFAPGAPRRRAAADTLPARSIHLRLDPADAGSGDEGYALRVATDRVSISARTPAGLFYGVQTLRQALPPSVEHPAALNRTLHVPTGTITDRPRFAWRGTMLDVSRHFLTPAEVKRYVDHMAFYKLNRLHMHLSDDQGWRIEIKSWPNLARHGGSTEVGGGTGGYYTQAEFSDLVAYAANRYVMIVPEIDVPAHTNAALASYASLNCDRVAPPLYTGIKVGFSALCVERDSVYRFVDDVIREITALTPSPWFHIGGDEVEKLTHDQYKAFIERVQGMVRARGKEVIGWSEIATANIVPTTVVQHWIPDSSASHVARGGKVILSPAKKLYLDMKYDSSTVLGLRWAAQIEVRDAYDWDPATWFAGVPESAILGVEAPLWGETVEKLSDYEQLAFPRLIAVAEMGWSPQGQRGWDGFRRRLAAHGPRMQALGINFYRSPQVDWRR